MKKLMMAGAAIALMGIAACDASLETSEASTPAPEVGSLESIQAMNQASKDFISQHPMPKKYCYNDAVLLYDDLNEALIAGHYTTKLCHEGKATRDPENDGVCYVSAVFDRNIQANMECIMTVIARQTAFDSGNGDEIEQSLRFLTRYNETRQTYRDLETYKQLNR